MYANRKSIARQVFDKMDNEEAARKAAFQADNQKLAKEFSQPGTLKNFMIRQGFLPDNEEKAEALMKSIIDSE